jgi:hypothetical protein
MCVSVGACTVFLLLPHASPSVVFPVMLFVQPTAAHCHLLFTLLFLAVKANVKKPLTLKDKKTRQEKQPQAILT